MIPLVLDPADGLERQNEKLRQITGVLMRRIERDLADDRHGYAQFQLAAALEEQVRARTRDLDEALQMLSIANARLTGARREAEQARNDLYAALEAVQHGFALFDPEDRLILSNSRFSAQLPDVAAQLGTGLSFADYVRLLSDSPHMELHDCPTRAEWTRQRLSRHRHQHVDFIVRLTGDRWLQVSEYRSPSGGTAVIQTDVTAMIRGERAERDRLLDDQARLLRATLDHIKEGVAIFDRQHLLAGWNQRLRELVALPVNLMATGTEVDALIEYLRAGGRFGPDASMAQLADWVAVDHLRPPITLEVRRSDGAIFEVFGQGMPDGGFLVSFTDLTGEREAVAAMHRAKETLEQRVAERTRELETARDAAERANASKSRFVAGTSHDLLQPLNAAKLFLSSLNHTDLDPDQRAITERIQSAYESVETILGALLDISNLDIGAARADISAIPLAPLLRGIDQEFRPLARERGLELRVIPCSAWVESDPTYLRRILQNLVVNALRYTRRGRVLVGARRFGERVRLEVWDTGPGIPPERKADVFREFVRLDASPGVPRGMGLGLAIVERACALLDHPLSLESQPGRGTHFTVTAPRACDAGASGDHHADPQPPEALPLDDMIAVVIENDDGARQAMVSVLEDWGVSPVEASSAAAAEALVGDIGVAPDVIIADFLLDDDRNGIDAIARLRAAYGPIPAVLVSADRSLELRRLASRSDVTLLHKPLELHRLRAVLHWAKHASGHAAED